MSSDSSVKHDWLRDRNTEHVHVYLQQRQLVVVVVVDISRKNLCCTLKEIWVLQLIPELSRKRLADKE